MKSAGVAAMAAAMSGALADAEHHRSPAPPGSVGSPDSGADLADGHSASSLQVEGFNEAIGNVFPMTPEMVRQYRRIHEENERAVKEEPFPEPLVDAVLVSLEPGEMPIELKVAPGIASAIGFHDATGRPWPVQQFVIGNRDEFRVIQLGENSNSLAVSPLSRVGWTNLIVALEGEPTPVVLRIAIDRRHTHFRRTVQVMKLGPGSPELAAGTLTELPAAGDRIMLATLSGVDLPAGAARVEVVGVDGDAWIVGGDLFLRSRHALLSPAWTASLAGPGRLRAYRLQMASSLLFSVDGRIVRASLVLP